MKYNAKYIKTVGKDNISLYELNPPCECGTDYVYVKDPSIEKIRCPYCFELFSVSFEEVRS